MLKNQDQFKKNQSKYFRMVKDKRNIRQKRFAQKQKSNSEGCRCSEVYQLCKQ